jgi:hypothetical protein
MKWWFALPVIVGLSAWITCSSPNRNGAGGRTGGTGGSQATGGTSDGTGGTATGGTAGTGGDVAEGGTGGTTDSGGVSGGTGGGSTGGVSTGGVSTGGVSTGGKGGGGAAGGGAAGATGGALSGPPAPCDIYEAGGTPCAAAHATARTLYVNYKGPLYQVQRASDKATKDIMVGDGGFADMATQDSFCSGTTCTIPIIYDQSGNGNHLRVTWWAYWLRDGGKPANAAAQKIKVGGHTVSGIMNTGFKDNVGYRTGVQLPGKASVTKGSDTVTFTTAQTLPANVPLFFAANTADCPPDSWPNNCKFSPFWTAEAITDAKTVKLKNAYTGTSSSSTDVWNHATKNMPVGDESEAMYAVLDAKRYSEYCCFSYGNAEMTGWDEGDATMECIYYGNCTQFGQSGGGSGPWVGADLENGMYEGWENGSAKVPSNTSITGMTYVTAMVKGPSAADCPASLKTSGCFGLKAGNAQSGKLEWKFNANTKTYGSRPKPPNYSPQKKQGAVILATGGDGSNGGTGTWFEGAIVKGLPSDATDDAVQANIVAAGYGK